MRAALRQTLILIISGVRSAVSAQQCNGDYNQSESSLNCVLSPIFSLKRPWLLWLRLFHGNWILRSMLRKYSSFIKHTKHLDFKYIFLNIVDGKWWDYPFFLFFIWKINACKGHSFKLKRVSSLFFIYYQ